jgi:tryptophanyl-tRNA synthetase
MSATAAKRIFSGIQPTGIPHLGNYLGAIRNWVKLQEEFPSVLYCIVDLHSLTVPQHPLQLKDNIFQMAACLLACGVNPEKSILFQQSKVPQHAELTWMLTCGTPVGWLNRMTQWKSKVKSKDSLLLGLYSYPVLMAADILLYNTTHVPVGEDQVQHIELTRDIAKSFNSQYQTCVFTEPQTILGSFPRVMSLRNPQQKMSKSDPSDHSRITLLDTPDQIRAKIAKAVTDSISTLTYDHTHRPGVANLISLYGNITGLSNESVCGCFEGKQSVHLKEELAELIIEALSPVRQKTEELLEDRDYVRTVLSEGNCKAKGLASSVISTVKHTLGIS